MIIKKPLTQEQKNNPTQKDILSAQDQLFMNILLRLNNLEVQNGNLPTLQSKRNSKKI